MGKGKLEKGETRTSRIQSVNIDTQVNGFRRPDSVPDFLDYSRCSYYVNFPRLYDFKSTVAIVFVIGGAGECCADAGVDVTVVGEEAFLGGVEEIGAVVYAGLF